MCGHDIDSNQTRIVDNIKNPNLVRKHHIGFE